jgi:putative nucleotidyltransferase with HDIG domain
MRLQDYVANNAAPPSMDALVSRIQDISSLPAVAVKTMEIANDPDSSTLDLVKVVETDPSLSARILRCVNSSAYSLRGRITNLQRAISFLGMREIRRLAVTASVSELFTQDEAIGHYRRRGLWKHLVAVGLCARLIAMRQKMAGFEDAFLAGLLHDIGIVFEDQYAHERFCAVIGALNNNTPLVETERKYLGFDHTRLGVKVAESWRFPECVKAAIGYHHLSINYRGEAIAIVRCVEVANLICTVKEYSSVGRKLVQVSQPALTGLSLTREHLSVLAQDLDEELAKNASLLEL